MPRKLAAGNWKMNGIGASLVEVEALLAAWPNAGCDILLCPPATLLSRMAERVSGSSIAVGGQDCHVAASGAHTGDISADMIAEAGGSHVILGHSERRADHGEDDALVAAKTAAAWGAGLIAVVCVGETLDEREAGRTIDVVAGQLAGSVPDGATAANTVIAYEPVWAIGTGKVPTLDEIGAVHDDIRARLSDRFGAEGDGIRILYGGSVKPSNAAEIFAVSNVDGALVGGASLKADDFGGIISALQNA
ncbi:triose-phosphate isomerase [Alphaproteobacteria bacterium GH1-50]|uniref:Triosephosphate isomerase n=1 Tax=Kangsaoukella pontilimi TaxID=2691042 RepID=A0A7C9MCD5_9RHOB|nr:triose-phosphate isomerase [Kangsaoukella pontilimi]MXQ07032.1 triose-phosphate isomerase [Kangsaoukella pontilimi]